MLKISLLVVIAVVLFVSMRAFGRSSEQDPATAFAKIAQGATVIDVRTAEEFAAGHLPEAHNIPYEQIIAGVEKLNIGKDQPVVVYCRSGHRAGIAKTALEKSGYTQIYNAGGLQKLQAFKQKN
ncbi:rhodanese-like domain-containing protein [Shewanella yunxiaonensis]|uniref:Rhodanese-like domain-containing protein n=1 Tax=Shewanella yunxiaonensis TaxID=2829809 RepID=A0ABX7YPW5_9GAMM|nr:MULTISPECIES: rhodanese-like domain-containing protein [Shewanella]MDF0533601.1 rhodanese-like domain-containing protein [Shewanella sp. A32]QUN04649.1 rhodanese-like domain-containing protein [Shewanella yunxiaonensis]